MRALDAMTLPLTGRQLIEASAGTGKTYTIANLYLRLLLGHGTRRPFGVDEILVLTFTIAATEELRARIRQRISEARQAFVDGQSKDPFLSALIEQTDSQNMAVTLLSAAVRLMDEGSIFTIHGFCARTLSEQNFETGLLFDQNLDGDKDQLLQQACQDSFRELISRETGLRREIALTLWQSPEDLLGALKGYLFRPNLTLLPDTANVDERLAALVDDMKEAKQLWLADEIADKLANCGLKKNSKPFTRLAAMTEFCSHGYITTDIELWQIYSPDSLEKAVTKAGEIPVLPCLDVIARINHNLGVLEDLTADLWRQLITHVRERLVMLKQTTNVLTLDDLLEQLHSAMERNPALVTLLRERFPVALIDEFQDTDDIQYEMFSRLYPDNDDQGLLLIGDPKQAIYQFRGADVFTYINARRQTRGEPWSLAVNWRSTAPMVQAVNHLFDQPGIFQNDKDIPFTPVAPSPEATTMSVTIDGQVPVPVTVNVVETPDKKATNVGDARNRLASQAAEQVVALLSGNSLVNEKPLNAGQIAFLVRGKRDAAVVRDALAERQLRSVYVTLESVFLQETASDLKTIMEAVLEPTNERAIKAALATRLMQLPVEEVEAFNTNVITQQLVLEEFSEYHELWARQDIAPMINALIKQRQLAHRWLHQVDGDREMTNLRHLAELLQQRSTTAPGMYRLLKWFTREKLAAETMAAEASQVRLESDRDIVKIVTMHAAKGLQYDVVFIPFAPFRFEARGNEPALFHREHSSGFDTCLELGSNAHHRLAASNESLAEDMRILYVAITRARFLCYIGLADVRQLEKTAAAQLFKVGKDQSLSTVTSKLPAAYFRTERVTTDPPVTVIANEIDAADLKAPPPYPTVRDAWRVHSYTGISRRLTEDDHGSSTTLSVAGYGDDDTDDVETSTYSPQHTRHTFTRGPQIGVALHSLMEHLDFQANNAGLEEAAIQFLKQTGQEQPDTWKPVLANWLRDILNTPLTDDPQALRLSQVANPDRLDELEFYFPLASGPAFIQLLQDKGYAANIDARTLGSLSGMMTGLIDLVVRHKDRYYLIDYKSNYLGEGQLAYTPDALQDAMVHHRYDIQYLIYAVALHRYLAFSLPDYDYNQHFGGVYYLFLRGMDGSPGAGVFTDQPPLTLVQALDAELGDEVAADE